MRKFSETKWAAVVAKWKRIGIGYGDTDGRDLWLRTPRFDFNVYKRSESNWSRQILRGGLEVVGKAKPNLERIGFSVVLRSSGESLGWANVFHSVSVCLKTLPRSGEEAYEALLANKENAEHLDIVQGCKSECIRLVDQFLKCV